MEQWAMAAGLQRYFTGRFCCHGHLSERHTKSGECIACGTKKAALFKKRNPEKAKQWKKSWSARNVKLVNAMWKRCYWKSQDLRERHALHVASWRKRHTDVRAAAEGKRRSRQSSGTPRWADHDAIAMIYTAAKIFRTSGFDVHVDHVIPLQSRTVSGLHVHDNLQIIAAAKNHSKSNHFGN